MGGRILVYALNGKNVLWINPKNEGKPYMSVKPYGHLGAGRFYYGPENSGPKSFQLFLESGRVKSLYPERIYGDIAAPTVSIFYDKDTMCEIEPLDPLEVLEPGEAASFTERW